jgi:hypothetical protein
MSIDRLVLLDWLLPHYEPGTASIMCLKGKNEGPGWANGEADVARAIKAYRAGALSAEQFASITQDGKQYVIADGTRHGLVPHRDCLVVRFCLAFDDHECDGGNVHLAESVDRFPGAESVKFTRKGGKGLHCYNALAEPMSVEAFVDWARPGVSTSVATSSAFPRCGSGDHCYAYTLGSLDLYLRDYIPGYRGRGPCIVINDIALAEDHADEDLEHRTQSTVIHELGHIVDRPAVYEDRTGVDPMKLKFEYLVVAHITAKPMREEIPRYHGHEAKFIRICLHLCHRAKQLGFDIYHAAVCAGYRNGLSHASQYL